ncbi:hypothetical protein GAO09_25260 [Rhizobiales bacterium RZME27]|uniref:Uncharacterized protein n=1 Tax=Endobacterium cereale TaxID=2663029 RepID=A0A6A8AHV7_9HYPH|nr:hypothetical protein [Endobacterium cereale]MEB2848484.1 hypothetical protein [Endobacterium cereale]MQY49350.1 hypothetical protein [Endobacterium cereale]
MNVQVTRTKTEAVEHREPGTGEAAFERAIAVARAANSPPHGDERNPDYRMATNSEVWPAVEKISIVDMPEKARTDEDATDAIAYQADGDEKITVIRRDDNPKFYEYISGISKIPEKDLKLAKEAIGDGGKDDNRKEFLRDDGRDKIKLGDVWTVSKISDSTIYVNMNVGVDGAHLRFVSKELTPELFAKLDAMNSADKDGYKLIKDENGIKDQDLADGASIYRPDEDNGLIRVDMKNGDKKYVSADTTPKLYEFLSGKSDEFSGPGRDKAVDEAREKAGLPSPEELDIAALKTTEKDKDGKELTVTELAWQNAMKTWKEGVEKGDIKADDDRAKLLNALQAQSIRESGLDMATLSISMGNDITKANGKDFEQIIDGDKVAKSVSDLLGSEAVGKDIAAARSEALKKVDGGDAVIKELTDMAFGVDYAKYIQDLTRNGQNETAKDDISSVYSALLVADPEKAKEFAQNMQLDSMTMELDDLMGDPGKISEENLTQAGADIVKMLLTAAKKGGLDIGRRLAESEKFLNEVLGNKQSAKDFAKAMQEIGAIYSKNGEIKSSDIENLFKNGKYKTIAEGAGGEGLKFFNDMTKAGVIGSIGGGISLVSGVYQLASKGGKIGDTPEERLSVAKDFVSFVGAGKHFGDLANHIIGEHNQDVKEYNEKLEKANPPLENIDDLKRTPAKPLLGLDKTFDDLFKAPSGKEGGGLTMTNELTEAFQTELSKAVEGTDKPEFYENLLEKADIKNSEALAKGLIDGYEMRPDIKGINNWHRGASAALLVMSAGADTFAGAADVAIGALTIKKGLASGDDTTVAKGALQVAAGGFGTIGGVSSLLGLSKGLSLAKAFAAPSFVISAVLSLATLIPDIINDIKRSEEITGYRDKLRDMFTQMDKDGLLTEDGLDKYRFLDAYIRNYGQRDAPDNESILTYRQEELENFLSYISEHRDIIDRQFTTDLGLFVDETDKHPDYDGDGDNLDSQMPWTS